MALPSVDIQLLSGGLGKVAPSDDRVMGLIIDGVADRVLQIFSFTDALPHATAASPQYGANYLQQIKEFYLAAGDGAELWIQSVLPTAVSFDLFNPGGIVGTLVEASGGRINVVGVCRFENPIDNPTVLTNGIDSDTMACLPLAQAMAEDFATRHKPFRVILDGKYFTGDPAVLANLKTYTDPRVGICMASTSATSKSACIGLLLGRLAATPPNRNIGRVKDGAVPVAQAYLTSGDTVETFGSKATALHDKGFIFLRKFTGKAGYFWNDDHMATADTDDYASLSNGRVIDKVSRIAYTTYLNELLDTVLVDANTGKIAPTVIKAYQAEIERAIVLSMQAAGEISGVRAYIDPAQDILATSHLYIDVRIIPTGTNRAITVRLGLYNPLTA